MVRVGVVVGSLLVALLVAVALIVFNPGWLLGTSLPNSADRGTQTRPPAGADRDPLAGIERAINTHDAAAVERLLATGLDPDSADADGEILLNKAVLFGTPEIVEIMLEAGADPDAPGKTGLGPLAVAALAGHHEMLERLMQASAVHAASSPPFSAPATPGAQASPYAPPQAAAIVAAALAGPAGLDVEIGSDADRRRLAALPGAEPPNGAPFEATANGGAPAAPAASPSAPAPADAAVPPDGTASASTLPASWIFAAQRRLGELGYYKGAVDGIAGSQTAGAIMAYQAVAGLPQDGLLDRELLARIGARLEPEQDPPVRHGDSRAVPTDDRAATPGPQSRRDPIQAGLDRKLDDDSRSEAMIAHCRRNPYALVYDEATKRPVSCRDLIAPAVR